jgi:sulfate transport system ATP-binding protein
MTITVRSLTKRFDRFTALDDVSVDVPGGALVALLGPSGSGKTTLLRILAGLERPDTGSALIDGTDLAAQSARQRNIGLVFQHYALFRHLTVFENVAFALRVRKRPAAEVDARVGELLRLVQLEFGALDAQVRAELRAWLRRLHDEIHLTTVFVTHDQDEAFEVADKVVIMNAGKVEQVGAPAEVFEHPANDFVMRFLGHVNVLAAELGRGRAQVGEVSVPVDDLGEQRAGHIYVRPHDFEIGREPAVDAFPARVLRVTPLSAGIKVELDTPKLGANVRADVDWERGSRLHLRDGDDVFVSLRRARVFATAA